MYDTPLLLVRSFFLTAAARSSEGNHEEIIEKHVVVLSTSTEYGTMTISRLGASTGSTLVYGIPALQ